MSVLTLAPAAADGLMSDVSCGEVREGVENPPPSFMRIHILMSARRLMPLVVSRPHERHPHLTHRCALLRIDACHVGLIIVLGWRTLRLPTRKRTVGMRRSASQQCEGQRTKNDRQCQKKTAQPRCAISPESPVARGLCIARRPVHLLCGATSRRTPPSEATTYPRASM